VARPSIDKQHVKKTIHTHTHTFFIAAHMSGQ
jgi:hypothetical protein